MPDRLEDVDFGRIDFSFAVLQDKANFFQQEIKFKEFTIRNGKKTLIQSSLTDRPDLGTEYGFFGRIKPCYLKSLPVGDGLEMQEVFYGGVRFVRQIKNYYEFELPNPITSHADFRGTSGAPVMDAKGTLVSLITHGYEGASNIYEIALADLRNGIDATLLTEG